MKVLVLKELHDYSSETHYSPGDTVEIADGAADALIEQGVCKAYEETKPEAKRPRRKSN